MEVVSGRIPVGFRENLHQGKDVRINGVNSHYNFQGCKFITEVLQY